MPSEYAAAPLTPGNCACVLAGTWLFHIGHVCGSLPDGLIWPNSSAPVAAPPSAPGYHVCSTPLTCDSHGMSTAEPVWSTTTVCGFAAATAETSASWLPGRLRLDRSLPSLSLSRTKTSAIAAAFAVAAAWVGSEPSA